MTSRRRMDEYVMTTMTMENGILCFCAPPAALSLSLYLPSATQTVDMYFFRLFIFLFFFTQHFLSATKTSLDFSFVPFRHFF